MQWRALHSADGKHLRDKSWATRISQLRYSRIISHDWPWLGAGCLSAHVNTPHSVWFMPDRDQWETNGNVEIRSTLKTNDTCGAGFDEGSKMKKQS